MRKEIVDKRIPLTPEATLKIGEYTITELVERDRGGSCIVYDGRYQSRKVIVKEFYPVNPPISREEKTGQLEIPPDVEEEFKQKKKDFLEGTKKFEYFSLENRDYATERVIEKGEANNTCYIFAYADKGCSLNQLGDDRANLNLCDVARIMRMICTVIAKIHQEKKLYLDLKPGNIWYYNPEFDDNTYIRLFDFDTVTSLNDLQEDRYIPKSSLGYAASELVFGKTEEIGYHTDVYAIGMVFYWLLTGDMHLEQRTVENILLGAESWMNKPDCLLEIHKTGNEKKDREIKSVVGTLLEELLEDKKRIEYKNSDSAVKTVYRTKFGELEAMAAGENYTYNAQNDTIEKIEAIVESAKEQINKTIAHNTRAILEGQTDISENLLQTRKDLVSALFENQHSTEKSLKMMESKINLLTLALIKDDNALKLHEQVSEYTQSSLDSNSPTKETTNNQAKTIIEKLKDAESWDGFPEHLREWITKTYKTSDDTYVLSIITFLQMQMEKLKKTDDNAEIYKYRLWTDRFMKDCMYPIAENVQIWKKYSTQLVKILEYAETYNYNFEYSPIDDSIDKDISPNFKIYLCISYWFSNEKDKFNQTLDSRLHLTQFITELKLKQYFGYGHTRIEKEPLELSEIKECDELYVPGMEPWQEPLASLYHTFGNAFDPPELIYAYEDYYFYLKHFKCSEKNEPARKRLEEITDKRIAKMKRLLKESRNDKNFLSKDRRKKRLFKLTAIIPQILMIVINICLLNMKGILQKTLSVKVVLIEFGICFAGLLVIDFFQFIFLSKKRRGQIKDLDKYRIFEFLFNLPFIGFVLEIILQWFVLFVPGIFQCLLLFFSIRLTNTSMPFWGWWVFIAADAVWANVVLVTYLFKGFKDGLKKIGKLFSWH